MKKELEPGTYEHYKGNKYKVFAVATHSETQDLLVVYQSLYGDREFWVRPLEMFNEVVNLNGELVPRFRLIEAATF